MLSSVYSVNSVVNSLLSPLRMHPMQTSFARLVISAALLTLPDVDRSSRAQCTGDAAPSRGKGQWKAGVARVMVTPPSRSS